VNQAKDSIPLSNAITGGLEEKRPSFEDKKNDVAARMSDLKAKIAAAREQANRVHVGMNLNDDSSLLLANPQSLESQQAQTKVSFFFRTADDGLIFYLGNEPGRKEEDFMTVEVDRGYPVLTIDLGSGPQRIMNDKYVADNQWYKATVDRSGKTVRFIIAEEDRRGQVEETVKEDYLQGSKSLFNVDRNSSKLYIGGLPPGVVRSPVRYSTYRGSIEDLVIGDEKVGLWNFKDAQNVAPALERDKFIDLHAETGLRFQGNGYAILDRTQFPLRERSAIGFQFKTRAKNGLIFLVGRGKKYMAIYMADGNVVFQYDLGGGPGMSKTSRMYNDGQWHTAEAVRSEQNSYLTVDSERINALSPGSQTTLPVGDYMYFGGYPGEHNYPDVSNR
jgi:laminin alpha 3/5